MKILWSSLVLVLLMSGCISRGYSDNNGANGGGHNSGGGKCGMMMNDTHANTKDV